MAAPQPLVAEVTRHGLAIDLAGFRARLGGERALSGVLGALTVHEIPHPGRPKHMARGYRKAYHIEKDAAKKETLFIPRVKGHLFTAGRNKQGARLLDAIRWSAADPLPAPRRLPAAATETDAPFYDYQQTTIDYLCGGALSEASVAAGKGVAYLQMDTGLGKTRVGAGVIARCGEPALVVVPTEAIGFQWVDEFAEAYPNMAVAFYRNLPEKSKKARVTPANTDVAIVIVNTYREKEPAFLDGYGTVVLDEAHEYCSPVNLKALWLSQTRRVLGMSATPESDPKGFDKYVALHLGPPIPAAKIPGCNVGAVHFRGLVRQVEYQGHPDHVETAVGGNGMVSAVLTIANLIRDPHRMRLVAGEIRRLRDLHLTASDTELAEYGLGPRPPEAATDKHPQGAVRRHGIFVFAEHREYLPALRDALMAAGVDDVLAPEIEDAPVPAPAAPNPNPVTILRGGVARDAVGRARQAGAHVVLTTYGFSRRGISLPDMTAMVLTSPRRNGSVQILGRILRRGSDESILRQVVDIVDVRTGLKSQSSTRRAAYRAKDWPIQKVKMDWQMFQDGQPADAALPEVEVEAVGDDGLGELDNDALLEAALG